MSSAQKLLSYQVGFCVDSLLRVGIAKAQLKSSIPSSAPERKNEPLLGFNSPHYSLEGKVIFVLPLGKVPSHMNKRLKLSSHPFHLLLLSTDAKVPDTVSSVLICHSK